MKLISTETMVKHLFDDLSERRKSCGELSIGFIHLNLNRAAPAVNTLIGLYNNKLYSTCEALNINVISHTVSTSETMFSETRDAITVLNTNRLCDGILCEYPFSNRQLFQHANIPLTKDIECLRATWSNGIRYPMEQPFVFIMNYLLRMHGIPNDLLKISVISTSYTTHGGIIPYMNYIFGKYTFISHLQDYSEMFNDDVVVSMMMNVATPKNIQATSPYNAKLVLDYGYLTTGELISIDRTLFGKDTEFYSWDTALIDLYIYAILNNLIVMKEKK